MITSSRSTRFWRTRKRDYAGLMMKTLLGLPVRAAIQRLEAQGASYTLVKTEEPKKSLHGTDERVVRVKNKMVLFSL